MLAYSSDIYLIKTTELQQLPQSATPEDAKEIIVLLDAEKGDTLMSGINEVQTSAEEYLPVRLAYQSYPKCKSFFINLIKTIKRKHYITSPRAYTVPLQCLYANQVLRGERTAANAYEWTNKRWQMSAEEKQKRWDDLYNSLKTKGFDRKDPILLVLNRCLGVKDQIFQGHHRLGICKELGITEVSVSFWAVHRSFDWLKLFVRKKV
ncbi:MAG: ParB N-terminal domain-containing protein [Acetobacter sp.]|nr:ParB N-terminal domain-containing protein [Acetobacter sp.]